MKKQTVIYKENIDSVLNLAISFKVFKTFVRISEYYWLLYLEYQLLATLWSDLNKPAVFYFLLTHYWISKQSYHGFPHGKPVV